MAPPLEFAQSLSLADADLPVPATEAAPAGRTSQATFLFRLARVGCHLVRGVAVAALVFPLVGRERKRAHIQRWSRRLLDILAVRVQVSGEPPHGASAPVMLVANHVSWLDIFALSAVLPASFVAKAEMRAWPVLGWLGDKAGTLFIRRARRSDTARIGERLAQLMRGGEPVAVFPEGTTSEGTTVLDFHSSLLQPAVLTGAAVCPVAIRYARTDGTRCAEASYYGDLSMWDSIKRVMTHPATFAQLAFLVPVASAGRHRREVACSAREAIFESLFPQSGGQSR